jgi:PEP-CTERM motif
MKLRAVARLAFAFVLAAPLTSHADVSAYSQDFDSLALPPPFPGSNGALSDDGWLAFANVFTAGGVYLGGYGLPAPNSLAAWSAVGSGGSETPDNQNMGVYSDYTNNIAHGSGQLVEANVYQQRTVGAADIGTTWTFRFDAKLFNLAAPSTAQAFIRTLDPDNDFQTTASVSVPMTTTSATSWITYSLPFTITASAGQILQFGFSSTATNYNLSGIVYDNISLAPVPEPATHALILAGLGLMGAVVRRRAGAGRS